MNENETTEMTAEQKEQLIAKANEVVETYTHDDAEPLTHLAEMVEILGYNAIAERIWDMQGKAGSSDFDREWVNKMYTSFGFSEGEIDKESSNATLSWSINDLTDNLQARRMDNTKGSYEAERAEEIKREEITSPIQAARALKAEFESGKGAMCPETFVRNHITSLNNKVLHAFDYSANVVSGAISASAISAINGGKYDGWTEDDFAREYIKSMQELCNAASQYYGPVQFDNFKRHLDDTAKRFGIGQKAGQEVQESMETKTNEHEKIGGAIRMAIWNASEGMREYTFHEFYDGVADYKDMIDKWQNGSHSSELSPKLGLTFYLKDADDNDGPLFYEIRDKRLEFDKRITVFDAEHGYNTHMEEEIPDYAAYPIKSSWKECVFDIKKELQLRHIDENKKYGWPLGDLNPDKDMFNIFAKKLKAERQKDSNKDVPIVNLGKRVYHALSPDERKYVNNFLNSSNIHSDKAMEKLLLKAIGEPVKAKKRQHDNSRER